MSAPDAPFLVAGRGRAVWLERGGRPAEMQAALALQRAERQPPVVVDGPSTFRRLDSARLRAFDLLELFAFVRPARFVLPTVNGLAQALDLPPPADLGQQAEILARAETGLFRELETLDGAERQAAARLAFTLARAGWPWGPAVLRALGAGDGAAAPLGGLDVWTRLADWHEQAPEPAPEDQPVSVQEARERLAELLGPEAESRPAQTEYSAIAAQAFAPRDRAGEPNFVIAEAGTGIGKTLGYIAPASVWADKNGAPVWISTYTRNLQRQIDQELDRLYPDPAEKAEKVVVRKGRENYLCLLNLEEAVQGGAARAVDTVPLGLMARWAGATRDGDMVGGDFPAWLQTLFGRPRTIGLTDRRGECLYSACPHYRKCFIERSRRKARRAHIVIANHALVMIRAAQALGDERLPPRYVFDEGHHVFDAADSAFSAHLSGLETAELRRWLGGAEGGRRRSARGLERRIGELLAGDEAGEAALRRCVRQASILPGDGWLERLGQAAPQGPTETFLGLVRQQVLARGADRDGGFDLECTATPPVDGVLAAAATLRAALADLARPVAVVQERLAQLLDDEAAELDTATRLRIEAAITSLERRARAPLAAWSAMLGDLEGETPAAFVDWFAIARRAGRDADIGFHRHWIDPTAPLAETALKPAHGVLVTSATLLDRTIEAEADWAAAELRTGAQHLARPAVRTSLASPFDYGALTRILVVTDVRRDNPDQVAAAYRELFLAAGGGALGLFTAIWRLRAVHARLAEPLDRAGLALYAQHVDPIDTPTLVDIFRAEPESCLLGTDAVRDGVDVPGRALRLIVFDRVPWPRPSILHRARRRAFGGTAYDDMLTRLRLKQAYGRLVRRADDRGVFVMLDAMLPSRLKGAFPPEVEVRRLGLADAVATVAEFLASAGG